MIPIFFILSPISYIAAKHYIAGAVRDKTIEGIREGTIKANSEVQKVLVVQERVFRTSTMTDISLILLVGLFIPYVFILLGYFFDLSDDIGYKSITVLVVCTVYCATAINSALKTLKNISKIRLYVSVFIANKFDIRKTLHCLVYDEVYQKVYREVKREVDSLSWFERKMNEWFGEKPEVVARRIANNTFDDMYKCMLATIKRIVIIVAVYLLLFRFIVAPLLIGDATGFNLLQAFFYPFAYSLDFFMEKLGINLDLTSYIV